MNRLLSFIFAALLITSLAGLPWECQTKPHQQAADVENLRCEYLVNPLGIDVAWPRLSWIIESNRRGERQTAFQGNPNICLHWIPSEIILSGKNSTSREGLNQGVS